MPAKHGKTTNHWEYLGYTMVKPFDLFKYHGTKLLITLHTATIIYFVVGMCMHAQFIN